MTTAVILMESAKTAMRQKTTMVDPGMDALTWLRKQLEGECPDLARAMLERVAGELMGAEADAICGAGYGERSPERGNQRNGLPAPALGHPRGHDRARVPEAPIRLLLPRLVDGATPAAEKALVAAICDA